MITLARNTALILLLTLLAACGDAPPARPELAGWPGIAEPRTEGDVSIVEIAGYYQVRSNRATGERRLTTADGTSVFAGTERAGQTVYALVAASAAISGDFVDDLAADDPRPEAFLLDPSTGELLLGITRAEVQSLRSRMYPVGASPFDEDNTRITPTLGELIDDPTRLIVVPSGR